jgi:hypothetical protein
MEKKQLTMDDLINGWLYKYHGITVAELVTEKLELCKTGGWYKEYAVTQEQHDEWHEWAIRVFAKHFRISLKRARKSFVWTYLDAAPTIKNI